LILNLLGLMVDAGIKDLSTDYQVKDDAFMRL
jgi:hypothetical protein